MAVKEKSFKEFLKTAGKIGKAAGKVVGKTTAVTSDILAVEAGKITNAGVGAVRGIGKVATRDVGQRSALGKRLLGDAPIQEHSNLLGKKLTGVGFAAIGVSAAVGGTREGIEEMHAKRVGQRDGGVYRATPAIPSYENNAGATGDLVFALNNNRRG